MQSQTKTISILGRISEPVFWVQRYSCCEFRDLTGFASDEEGERKEHSS